MTSTLQGCRAIPVLRCSTDEQAATSIDDQLSICAHFADQHGIALLEPIRLAGVSGSVRTNIDKVIDVIIERKNSGEDFDAIIVHDISRIGRLGSKALGYNETRLNDAGIELIDAESHIEDSSVASIIRSVKAVSAQKEGERTATNSARGSQASLRAGRRAAATRSPYGVDYLYCAPNGKRLYVVRHLGDGVRVKLDPDTGDVIQRFEKGVRFKKERLDVIEPVPGAPKHVEIVRRIYREKFIGHTGSHSIAKGLNDEDIDSPGGCEWTSGTVRSILNNPTYLGRGIANMHAHGVYCKQGEKQPELLNSNGRRVRQIRPRDDWYEVEYPALADYLEEDVRALAEAHQHQQFDRIAGGHVRPEKRSGPTHQYLLSGILHEVSTGSPMRGESTKGSRYRYYRLGRGGNTPSSSDPHLRRKLPMAAVDEAVLEAIERIMCSAEELRPALIAEVRRQEDQRLGTSDEIDRLEEELTTIERSATGLMKQLSGAFADSASEQLDRLGARKCAITERLEEIDGRPSLTDEQVERLVDEIIDRLTNMLNLLWEEQDSSLRRVAETLVSSATADLKTRSIEFEFAVPSDMLAGAEFAVVGPEACLGSVTPHRTYTWEPITIGSGSLQTPKRCSFKDHAQRFEPSRCETCTRKRRPAA